MSYHCQKMIWFDLSLKCLFSRRRYVSEGPQLYYGVDRTLLASIFQVFLTTGLLSDSSPYFLVVISGTQLVLTVQSNSLSVIEGIKLVRICADAFRKVKVA